MILALIVAVIWISVLDTGRFTLSEYAYKDKRIKKPVRMVFLSDLHCKMYGYEGTFLIEKIKELQPDMILMGGDMIVSMDGVEIETSDDIIGVRDSHEVGDEISVVVIRDGEEITVILTIGDGN